jgi:hypothetical protein
MPAGAAFTLAANEPSVVQFIHIIADYGKLLHAVNIATSPAGSFYNTSTQNVSTTLWGNIIKMFRYECSTPNGDC